jgi:hypothetical protein
MSCKTHRLLSSLGEDVLTDVDAAWIEEAERRYQEYKDGNRQGISAQDVFAKFQQIRDKTFADGEQYRSLSKNNI